MVLFMDGAIVEFSQIFILYSKRKIQHHQKKLLEKQTKRFPTKHFDFSHCAQIHSYIYEKTFHFVYNLCDILIKRTSPRKFLYPIFTR